MATAGADRISRTGLNRFNQDFLLVWLDKNTHDPSELLPITSRLRQQTPIIHPFTELESAMTFLKSIQYEQVLLVVSSIFADETLSQVRNLRIVQDVFIFDCNSSDQKINPDQCNAEVVVLNSRAELLAAVKERIVVFQKQVFNFSICDQMQRSTKDLSKESNAFLWYQVLFHVLRQMPADEQAKEEMLQVCSNYRQLSPCEEKIVQEYRDCHREDKAIHWYTRSTLIFKLLNQALRTEDMALIYQFRYLIHQLCAQIELEHRKQICRDEWILFRGFQLHKEEFERLKRSKGGLISVNSFFSTTRDKAVAIIFAGSDGSESELVSVLLEIQVHPTRLQSVFFADIEHLSAIHDEAEVLFSLGSTFQILSIDFDDKTGVWVIRLDGSDEGSDRIRDYYQLADRELHDRSPMTYFGMILNDNLDQPDRAVRYFRRLLQLLDREHPNRVDIYHLLGEAYSRKNDHVLARKCFMKVRAIYRNQSNQSSTNVTLNDLRSKLQLKEQNTNEASLEKAKLMHQVADLLEINERVVWLQRAHETYEQLKLPNPSMSACLDELAWAYRFDNQDKEYLATVYERFAVDEQYLPPENEQLCRNLEDIMEASFNLDDDRRFVKFCQGKLDDLSKTLVEDHSRLVHMRECLEKIVAKIDQFEQKQSELLNIFESTDPQDFTQLSQCLGAMAIHCYHHSLYNQSIQHSLKDLEMNRTMHPNIINILYHIACCYNQLNDYQHTFDYLRQILTLLESDRDVHAVNISIIRNDIDKVVAKAVKHHIEIAWESNMDQNRPVMVEKSTQPNTWKPKPVPQWAMPKSKALRQAFNYEQTPPKADEN